MSSCKRRVWVTMCEQADGSRTGKYNGFRYSSVPKDEPKAKKKTVRKAAKKKTTKRNTARRSKA